MQQELTTETQAYMKQAAVAQFLGVTRQTVAKWTREGILPQPYEIGTQKLYSKAEVVEAVENAKKSA